MNPHLLRYALAVQPLRNFGATLEIAAHVWVPQAPLLARCFLDGFLVLF